MTPSQLQFDNSFERCLPADPMDDASQRQVFSACYSRTRPTSVALPRLVANSPEASELIGLTQSAWRSKEWVDSLSGNFLLDGMSPISACYGGHQFGHWAGQLGDGRAISLGEVLTTSGKRWELQLKGAGPTPYSRTADGRAVMRSSVREFLCSEAMHHLGVPTTRALSLVDTGERVVRDMLYDGNARAEPGAVVCRMAPSFLRFGSFELPASRGETETLQSLLRYLLTVHFPELGPFGEQSVAAMFEEVCRRTARMVAEWMRVGFVHGVMNTDNMSMLGLTIDYGPYGWLEDFDPDWTPNTTDAGGRRYRFRNQPGIAQWNLVRLAEALGTVLDEPESLRAGLECYQREVQLQISEAFHDKLGLQRREYEPAVESSEGKGKPSMLGVNTGEPLIEQLGEVFTSAEIDMTLFFRNLAEITPNVLAQGGGKAALALLEPAFYKSEEFQNQGGAPLQTWLERYSERVIEDAADPTERRQRMLSVNPKYVLRNYLAQEAIDELERGEDSKLKALQRVLRRPYDEQPGEESLAAKRPEWARHRAGCSMLSCSS